MGIGRRSLWVLALGFAAAHAQERKAPPKGPPVDNTTDKTEKVMSKEEAARLFRSVDEIMAFAAADTGLPAVPHVKRRLVTRPEVNSYLRRSFDEDESAKRLQRSEIVLKKFGLLPRDYDLRPSLIRLLTEQVAGYYDDKTKTVNMLNWVDPDEQKPVLAHELTHALQDGRVGLEKWSSNGFHGTGHDVAEDNQHVAADEFETARQAVAEGQAMVVFVDWGLKGTGKTLRDVPEVGERLKAAAADPSSPELAHAPLLLQRSLAFPYADGLAFEQALLLAGGKQQAFAGALAAPPNSSWEVMNPAEYLRHAAVPMLHMPDVHPLLDRDYTPYDEGVMGELDVEMMASLFGAPEMGRALAPAWNGGIYYAAQNRGAADKASVASLGVFYASAWRSEAAARDFARLYEIALGRKYEGLRERKEDETAGEKVYTTREGDVFLRLEGKNFFASEGFPVATARQLRELATTAQGTGPERRADLPTRRQELTLGTAQSFGALRFTLR